VHQPILKKTFAQDGFWLKNGGPHFMPSRTASGLECINTATQPQERPVCGNVEVAADRKRNRMVYGEKTLFQYNSEINSYTKQ
jgi:hypothetical protein